MTDYLDALKDMAREAGAWALMTALLGLFAAVGAAILGGVAFALAWPLSYVFDANMSAIASVIAYIFIGTMFAVVLGNALVHHVRDRVRRKRFDRQRGGNT